MTTHSLSTLLLVAGRRAPVPLVVFEIVLGILVGPDCARPARSARRWAPW